MQKELISLHKFFHDIYRWFFFKYKFQMHLLQYLGVNPYCLLLFPYSKSYICQDLVFFSEYSCPHIIKSPMPQYSIIRLFSLELPYKILDCPGTLVDWLTLTFLTSLAWNSGVQLWCMMPIPPQSCKSIIQFQVI